MTTYILHGGMTSRESPDNDEFFRKFTGLVDKNCVNIMMCYWARDKSRWEELGKRDQSKIKSLSSKPVYFYVVRDPKDLFDKIAKYDVLYVAGGEAEFIEPMYPQLSQLRKYLENKVYIGSSMGAFLASSAYVLSKDTQDEMSVHRGVGLLPIQTLCHWDVEHKKDMKMKLLRKENPQQPIIALDECKFITMYL